LDGKGRVKIQKDKSKTLKKRKSAGFGISMGFGAGKESGSRPSKTGVNSHRQGLAAAPLTRRAILGINFEFLPF